ncbi:hypothetical protein CAEBREN_09352 [Caenorhabditis brenneri]|uniref:Uncharacterized protein n=1 Tax=Caenorhabditis brenneri TaxID=135651 RepID=G0P574_CAEBE|nr:hypothetical protein CAEBREN_09352 [Caenorhabditis brenneri]
MEAPEDLSFDTILVYIREEYLEQFKIPVKLRNFIINSIPLEFSKLPLGVEFTEPSFARENSMVHELEDVLKKEKKKTEEELKKVQEELENTQKKTNFLHLSCSICFCCEPYCFSRFSVVKLYLKR